MNSAQESRPAQMMVAGGRANSPSLIDTAARATASVRAATAGRRVETVALAGLLLAVNLVLLRWIVVWGSVEDFPFFVDLGRRAWAGLPLYDGVFKWAPLMGYAFAALPVIGYAGWAALHVAAALAMPGRLRWIVLLSFPFWADVQQGNVLTFLVLFGAWALRGQGWAIGATLIAAVLIPRPIMLPLVVLLLWRFPAWRGPFAGILVVAGAATLATGMAPEWIHASARATEDFGHVWNFAPSAFIGAAWIPFGLVLSAVLLRFRYVGLACLAASPYLLPYYLLFGLLDLADRDDRHDPVATSPASLGA